MSKMKKMKKLVIITRDIYNKIGGLTGTVESKNGNFVFTIPLKGNQLWEEIFGVDQRIAKMIRDNDVREVRMAEENIV